MKEEKIKKAEKEVKKNNLLIVGENPNKLKTKTIFPKIQFEEVLTAEDPVSAHKILEKKTITHLVCKQDLGGTVSGIVFLNFWKQEFPKIEEGILIVEVQEDRQEQDQSENSRRIEPRKNQTETVNHEDLKLHQGDLPGGRR